MTFKEAVAALAQKLGVEIAVEGDACALRASAKDGTAVTIWMQGSDDLFRDTGGATLSVNPDTGHVRIQRFDTLDALEDVGPAEAFAANSNVTCTSSCKITVA